MSIFDRFESAVERGVNGAFSRVFRSGIKPVDITTAIRRAMDDAAAFAGQDQERKAAIEALNAAEAAIYRANSALGSKVGKELDKDTKNRIKEAEKNLERLTRHKKPEKMTPQDTQALNAAREALQAQTKDLVARWEATREK